MNDLIINNKPPVYEGDEDFIFVSYSHKDKELVYSDIWALANAGLNIWYDDGLIAGNKWNQLVDDYIKKDNCKLVILFLSDNYVDSNAIKQEMEMIKKYNKPYFTINIGNTNISTLIAHALAKQTINIDEVAKLAPFFNDDVIYIGRTNEINDLSHIDEVIRHISKLGIKVNKKIINQMDNTKRVLIICKNSSFSSSIVSGIYDYLAKKKNITIEKCMIDKSYNKVDANLKLCEELIKNMDHYDGFMIRPIEKYDEKLKNIIKTLKANGKKVVLLDINMTDEQLSEFVEPPAYIGSDFKAGGRALGERITEISAKIGIEDTKIILLGGPFGNQSAKIRYEAMNKTLTDSIGTSNTHNYILSSLTESDAISDITEYAREWHKNNTFREKNVVIYCGNDNVAIALMHILSRKNPSSIIYSALKDCNKVIVVGYDGIRGANNEITLKNYGIDYITIDVVPFKQGVDAGKVMRNLLFNGTKTDSNNTAIYLTQPELIESISFPTEKYDNLKDVQYLFNNKKVIIFDLDGTIADTETFHWKAYNKLLQPYGVTLKHDKIKNYIGHSELDIYEFIKSDFDIDFDNDDFIQNRIQIYLNLVKEYDLQPFSFIYDILNKYKDSCEFILVTSQIPSVVDTLLDNWNLSEFFPLDHRFCCHDGKYKKAEIYRNINNYISSANYVSANDILLLEDSEHYMSAAKELGFSVIGIEHKYNLNSITSCDAILTKNAAKGLFIGLCGLDITYYSLTDLPENNSKKKISNYTAAIGGPAANAAITYSLLGGEAYLLTSIGNTEFGQIVKQMLKKYNIKVIDINNEPGHPCNISSIYVNTQNGDRTIISGQSNRKIKISGHSDLKEKIQKSEFVLYDGNLYGIEKEMTQYLEYFGVELVIDAGSYKEGFKECFSKEPTVISSESFVDSTGADVFEQNKNYSFKHCAKTRGGTSIQFEENGEIKEIAIPTVAAIDTLGAGDVFHGAYCFFKYVKNLDFESALKKAAQIATYSVQKMGVIEGVKFAKEEMIDDII